MRPFMPSLALAALLALPAIALSGEAGAQQVAESMRCDQVISQFARSGVIYKTVQGSALPMRAGVPIAKGDTVRCGGNGSSLRRLSVKTTDNPRCVYAVQCQ